MGILDEMEQDPAWVEHLAMLDRKKGLTRARA
jgi:hypothetical protein